MSLQAMSEKAKGFLAKDGFNYSWLIGLLLYFSVGFFTGLIFKFLGRIMLWLLLISLLGFLVFNYFGLITINLENFRNFLGVDDLTITQLFEFAWGWIQKNILQSIAWLVGFILAFELA